jgi:hypothetical protein
MRSVAEYLDRRDGIDEAITSQRTQVPDRATATGHDEGPALAQRA